ncbi:MAG: dipeptidase, partial [Bacteroidaceae bacterium]|nr:dipeptidase [Bacteroidaceae bacterium]
THCDTPMFFHEDIDFSRRDDRIQVDSSKMRDGGLDASIMVAYLPQRDRDEASLKAATAKANELLDGIEQRIASAPGVGLANTPADLRRLKAEGKLAIMRGIENGYAVGRDLSNVERFRRRGVVYMTLCHNGDNDICDSAARTNNEHGGLSAFGREVVREMNRVGMMVDLSHGGVRSFYDALELSTAPIVCSHASCRALCDHPRNLDDEQMKALAAKDGVMQVTLYPGFLRLDGEATILDAMAHLDHAVEVMGIDHVGLGSDFDGDGGVPGLASASEVINYTRQLLKRRYSVEQIQMLWGGNFLRVMEKVQRSGKLKTEN